ncbi:MAG: hypothetical protein N2234_00925 [Planctomycetota bacterium]|nr:hypothetical protein [Planctomycetota bacterium]
MKHLLLVSFICFSFFSSCSSTQEIPEASRPITMITYPPPPQLAPGQAEAIKAKIAALCPEGEVVRKTEEGFFSPSIDSLVEEGATAMPFLVNEYNRLYGDPTSDITRRHLLVEVSRRIASRAHLDFICWVLVRGSQTEKVTAAKSLLEFGNYGCVGALIAALDDTDREVVWRSGAALCRITGNDFGLRPEINDDDFKTAIYRWKLWYNDCYLKAFPNR